MAHVACQSEGVKKTSVYSSSSALTRQVGDVESCQRQLQPQRVESLAVARDHWAQLVNTVIQITGGVYVMSHRFACVFLGFRRDVFRAAEAAGARHCLIDPSVDRSRD